MDERRPWPTIARMGIGVHKASVEDLLGEYFKELSVDIGQIEFVASNLVHVGDFVAIHPFSR